MALLHRWRQCWRRARCGRWSRPGRGRRRRSCGCRSWCQLMRRWRLRRPRPMAGCGCRWWGRRDDRHVGFDSWVAGSDVVVVAARRRVATHMGAERVVLEADLSGGVLGARYGLGVDPGVVSLIAALRRSDDRAVRGRRSMVDVSARGVGGAGAGDGGTGPHRCGAVRPRAWLLGWPLMIGCGWSTRADSIWRARRCRWLEALALTVIVCGSVDRGSRPGPGKGRGTGAARRR